MIREHAPLTAAELEAAKQHFEEHPWIGKTHLGRMTAAATPAAAPARQDKAATKSAR